MQLSNPTNLRLTKFARISLLLGAMLALPLAAQATDFDKLLQDLQAQAPQPFSAERGAAFWSLKHSQSDGQDRSCALCHTTNLDQPGKHVKTQKVIEPMAPSVNPKRLTDVAKVEKWLLRNCKWVVGRECTAQEKGDVLTFIRDFKKP